MASFQHRSQLVEAKCGCETKLLRTDLDFARKYVFACVARRIGGHMVA